MIRLHPEYGTQRMQGRANSPAQEIEEIIIYQWNLRPNQNLPEGNHSSWANQSSVQGSPSPKTSSSPKPRPRPSARDTFCPKRIPTRPRRPLAPIKINNKKDKPKIIEVNRVDGLIKIINSRMFKLNLENK